MSTEYKKESEFSTFPAVRVQTSSRLHWPYGQVSWWVMSPFYNLFPLISFLNLQTSAETSVWPPARFGRHLCPSFVGTTYNWSMWWGPQRLGALIFPDWCSIRALISVLMWPQQPDITTFYHRIWVKTSSQHWISWFCCSRGRIWLLPDSWPEALLLFTSQTETLSIWQCFPTSGKSKNTTSTMKILCALF